MKLAVAVIEFVEDDQRKVGPGLGAAARSQPGKIWEA